MQTQSNYVMILPDGSLNFCNNFLKDFLIDEKTQLSNNCFINNPKYNSKKSLKPLTKVTPNGYKKFFFTRKKRV